MHHTRFGNDVFMKFTGVQPAQLMRLHALINKDMCVDVTCVELLSCKWDKEAESYTLEITMPTIETWSENSKTRTRAKSNHHVHAIFHALSVFPELDPEKMTFSTGMSDLLHVEENGFTICTLKWDRNSKTWGLCDNLQDMYGDVLPRTTYTALVKFCVAVIERANQEIGDPFKD